MNRDTHQPPDPGQASRQSPQADDPLHENGRPSDHFRSAVRQVEELRSYGQYWLNARLDALKVSVRNVVIYTILGVLAGLVALSLLITTGVMLIHGLISAVDAIPGVPYWLAALLVPIGILLIVAAGVWLALRKILHQSRRALLRKYEQERSRQRAEFGRDVHQRATGSGE